jgi:hypothetical protein
MTLHPLTTQQDCLDNAGIHARAARRIADEYRRNAPRWNERTRAAMLDTHERDAAAEWTWSALFTIAAFLR